MATDQWPSPGVVMKYFDRLIKDYICAFLPPSMDPLQFASRPNRSTDNVVSQVIDSYVRMLFIDFSSAFNTIVPTRLADKQIELGLKTPCAPGSWTF